ncbi:hypothetical protein [Streptococcus acidominimus]|uniref:Uncharacterized protein n=1 Tax=Streptococcus acidominimus TaxID=1326 RepID=A0A1Q8EFR2_STRAI|nr:hypothetical protein [Streptococcus acidominimus]OLF50651.1 hypothetical protein BU200_01115 [Streptococcus acidominimus]QBX13673.1 hypothetical protein Javan1_0033 [Streptococcus phage Javan1]SUN05080.1 Uncharacterised protein [Streptococcus acidominimus]
MNKRKKRKHELESRMRIAESTIDFLVDQNSQLWNLIERNALATNSELKILHDEVSTLKKHKKKSFFNRK